MEQQQHTITTQREREGDSQQQMKCIFLSTDKYYEIEHDFFHAIQKNNK